MGGSRFKEEKSSHLAVLGVEQEDGRAPHHPMVRSEIKLLSQQLHLMKEDTEREKVIREQRCKRFGGMLTY